VGAPCGRLAVAHAGTLPGARAPAPPTDIAPCRARRQRPRGDGPGQALYAASWAGLADGASAEGVPFGGHARPQLRCVAAPNLDKLPAAAYINSLAR
jgi:hypothetical protein